MRALVVSLTLSLAGVAPLSAQVGYYARLGATYSTALVRDQIVGEIEVQPGLAPSLWLGADLPVAPDYRAGLEASFTTSGYRSQEAGVDADLGTLTTGAVILGLEGSLASRIRWRAGIGLVQYWPSEDRGIFLSGGTRRLLGGLGLDYRRPIMTNWDLMASLRYDYHRFTTDELRSRGFSQSQAVQRVSASVGLSRGGR